MNLSYNVYRYKTLYAMMLIPIIGLFIFHYIPIYGLLIAFKDFKVIKGVLGSDWNNFQYFKDFFNNPYFSRILRNTFFISLLRIFFAFPATIIFSLLLNEIMHTRLKRWIQSITILPHFISWVVLAAIFFEVLSPNRGLPNLLTSFGVEPVSVFSNKEAFVPMLIVTEIWKSVGWGAIVYLAAISGINPELYEAAKIDGANRLQQALRITLPSITQVIIILFLLTLGNILNAGFDQIFNLYNPGVYSVADIIDTYVYRVGIIQGDFGYSAAVGFFKNVIGVALILLANVVVKKVSEYGLF